MDLIGVSVSQIASGLHSEGLEQNLPDGRERHSDSEIGGKSAAGVDQHRGGASLPAILNYIFGHAAPAYPIRVLPDRWRPTSGRSLCPSHMAGANVSLAEVFEHCS